MKKVSQLILVIFFISFIIPSLAFASWWNPFTWKFFHKKEPVPQIQVETQKTSEEKIAELQKLVDDLKKQQTNSATATTPIVEKKIVPKVVVPVSVKPTPTPVKISTPSIQKDSDGNILNPNIDYSKYTVNGQVLSPQDYSNYVARVLTQKEINPATGKAYTLDDFGLGEANKSNENSNPYVNLKVNEQDGPITIKTNSLVNVSWTSANVVSCSGSARDKPLNGRETINVDSDTISPFTIRCLTSNGIIVSDSVVLNITDKTPYNYDPYNVLSGDSINGEKIIYSPDQLNSIDCAYYGRNCPTIDVRIINR
jgi:hypothetical protein